MVGKCAETDVRNMCVTQILFESQQITLLGAVTWFLDLDLIELCAVEPIQTASEVTRIRIKFNAAAFCFKQTVAQCIKTREEGNISKSASANVKL